MSQGLTWIAGRRTPLLALVALFALTVGLFVALQSAFAADCATNPNITLGFAQPCTVTHADAETATSSDDEVAIAVIDVDTGVVTITGAASFSPVSETDATLKTTATITVTDDNGTTTDADAEADDVVWTYDVTLVGFGIVKAEIVDDSDNIVKAGATVTARVTLRSFAAAAQVRLVVPTTGLSIVADELGNTTQAEIAADTDVDGAGNGIYVFTINTAGAPDGEYTLSFTADDNGFGTADDNVNAEGQVDATATVTLTIGDAGTGLAAAELALGNSKSDVSYTADDETTPESGSAPAATGKINLVISATNSLGEKANSGDIDQITVIAPGGRITSTHLTAVTASSTALGTNSATLDEDDPNDDDEFDPGNVGATTVVTIAKADFKPGVVTVYALVLGPGGAATTESIDLTFTGPATGIVVLDADKALRSVNVITVATNGDKTTVESTVTLQVTATDASGLDADPPKSGVALAITDADGKRQSTGKMFPSQPDKASDGKFYITVTGYGDADAPLTAGEYTVTAKRGKLEGSGTFVVAGAVANIDLTVDDLAPDTVGQGLMLTATVTDDDGNTVVDGTEITITSSDVKGDADSVLVLVLQGADNNVGVAKTTNGVATARLVVVGSGSAVVTATSGGGFDVVVINSTAGDDAAVDEPDVEPADGLSQTELNNFASWSGEGSVSASELLAGIAGATGVLFYDGDSWQRYGVVDGQVIPGSRDFTIRSGQTIWISG